MHTRDILEKMVQGEDNIVVVGDVNLTTASEDPQPRQLDLLLRKQLKMERRRSLGSSRERGSRRNLMTPFLGDGAGRRQ